MWQTGELRSQFPPKETIRQAQKQLELLSLSEEDKAVLNYVLQLTIHPADMNSKNIESLRLMRFSDHEIHDIVLVISCFSFMNRLADGTGVRVLERRRKFAIALLGEECWKQHKRWSTGD